MKKSAFFYTFTSALVLLLALTLLFTAGLYTFAANEGEGGSENTSGAGEEKTETEAEAEAVPGTIITPDTFRVDGSAGVAISLRLGEGAFYAFQGALSYNSELLSYKEHSCAIEGWNVSVTVRDEAGTINFIAVNTTLSAPAVGDSPLMSVSFTVKDSARVGDSLEFSVSDLNASDGISDTVIPGSAATEAVGHKLFDSCLLTALDLGAGFSPAFSPDTMEYCLNVPFETESLSINYTAGEFATAEIIGNSFEVGQNTLILRVTSESGKNTADYVITVTRNRSSDYVPSGDASLSSLSLSDGMLSPSFSPDITEYTVYVKDGKSITVTAVTASEYAVAGTLVIDAGSAAVQKLTVTAENGAVREYSFTAVQISSVIGDTGEKAPVTDMTLYIVFGSVIALTAFFIGFIIALLIRRHGKKAEAEPNKEPQAPSAAAAPVMEISVPGVHDGDYNDTKTVGIVKDGDTAAAVIPTDGNEDDGVTKALPVLTDTKVFRIDGAEDTKEVPASSDTVELQIKDADETKIINSVLPDIHEDDNSNGNGK